MHRLLVQIDEETHEELRRRSFEEKRSIASIVRECLQKSKENPNEHSIRNYPFVGSGASRQGQRTAVSVNHDRALARAVASRSRRK